MEIPLNKRYKFDLLYGTLLGDGCLSKVGHNHYFISIVGNIKDDLEFFKYIVVPLIREFADNKISIRKRIKQRKLEILFTNRKLFTFIQSFGFPVGKKGIALKIPTLFTLKDAKFIIQGYFATDGSLVITNNNGIIYPRIEFSSISKSLLIQVLNTLRNLGMYGNIYLTKKYTNPNWNNIYRLQLNGRSNLEMFKNKIGFINPKHYKKYESFITQII